MPIPAIAYAAAYVGGNLGGIALGTAIVKKVMPRKASPSSSFNIGPSTPTGLGYDLSFLYGK
jgi:hypothetical protein